MVLVSTDLKLWSSLTFQPQAFPLIGDYPAGEARQTSAECKPCRVGGDMKVEVDKAVDEQPATGNRCAKLNPAGLMS